MTARFQPDAFSAIVLAMDKKDPMAIVHDNVESLDDGLDGFQRLFEAVSSNMRMQLSQLASGAPMPSAPSTAERDLQQRLKEREQQLVEMRRHLAEARKAVADRPAPPAAATADSAESRQRMETLETENARLRTEVTALQKELQLPMPAPADDGLEAENARLRTEMAELKAAPADDGLEAENVRLRAEVAELKATPPAPAASPATPAAASAATAGGLPGPLLCALAATVEETLGPASRGVAFRGGASLGKAMAANATNTEDPTAALGAIATAFRDGGVLYEFSGDDPAELTFDACAVRDALRAGGHELGGAACYLMCGLFSGAFEAVTGKRSKLEIVEAGPICRKTLKISE